MRGNGITYDTGFINARASTREPFDPEVVKREMRVIREDLHCNAVRITGGDPDRLEIAAAPVPGRLGGGAHVRCAVRWPPGQR